MELRFNATARTFGKDLSRALKGVNKDEFFNDVKMLDVDLVLGVNIGINEIRLIQFEIAEYVGSDKVKLSAKADYSFKPKTINVTINNNK